MEFVCIEELVPKDHLLPKSDRVIDFDFIQDKVKDLHCADSGRPAVDPVVLSRHGIKFMRPRQKLSWALTLKL